ncbi:hypothetical protein [Sodalis sp.]|uniref:hypothetical protein n=1 Tax=Sodalis sp. (in: enterobacteria) TaxID=1898979 RepID=UPI003873B0A1
MAIAYPRAVALLEQVGETSVLFSHGNDALRLFASSTIDNYILIDCQLLARGARHAAVIASGQ